uniref:Uncharacterized protein LOC102808383 n=1 Tax=Saccoglossus kowalevskii TaxID=10224 RepID=A0ABM0M8R7_SACKO|nr:PREDICTED: uncharacterized protein LOC102808383 [Saccoglossus kowalevskii]
MTKNAAMHVPNGVRIELQCELGYKVRSANINVCHNGTWKPRLLECEDIDECEDNSHDCDEDMTNNYCVNTLGGYKCVCISGYVANNGRCVPSVPGQEEDRCFESVTGMMRRRCDIDGKWLQPDTTACKSLVIMEVLNATVGDFIDTGAPFGGDILMTASILTDIVDMNPLAFTAQEGLKRLYIEGFLELTSKVLDDEMETMWKAIHNVHGIHKGVLRVFKAMDTFSKSVHALIRQTGYTINESTKNIDMTSEFIGGSSTKKRSVHEDIINNTCIELSQYFTKKNETDRLVCIRFIYQNPGDMLLPPIQIGKRSNKRQWVTSVTATRKIEMVNSKVVSVRLFGDDGSEIRRLDESLTFKYVHQKVGYDSKCVSMVYDDNTGIWSTDGCWVDRIMHEDITVCKCQHLGNLAVITAIGKPSVHGCKILSIFWYMALLTNATWILNLAVQELLRMRNYILRSKLARIIFLTTGWPAPIIIIVFCVELAENNGLDVSSESRCIESIAGKYLQALASISLVLYLVSGIITCKLVCGYEHAMMKYEVEEFFQIREEIQSLFLLKLALMSNWAIHIIAITTNNLIVEYMFALAIMFEGSVVFLALCATNVELLVAVRIRLCGGELYNNALEEVQHVDQIRADIRRRITQFSSAKTLEIKKRKQQHALERKHRADAINKIFTLATAKE